MYHRCSKSWSPSLLMVYLGKDGCSCRTGLTCYLTCTKQLTGTKRKARFEEYWNYKRIGSVYATKANRNSIRDSMLKHFEVFESQLRDLLDYQHNLYGVPVDIEGEVDKYKNMPKFCLRG